MTIIVYRHGVMASDSGSWSVGAVHAWTRKIARAADGTLYSATGHAPRVCEMLSWVDRGAHFASIPRLPQREDKESDVVLLRARAPTVTEPSPTLQLYTPYGWEEFPEAPYMAVGSNAQVAFGALYAGATAVEAVRATCEHGEYARLPVRYMKHEFDELFVEQR